MFRAAYAPTIDLVGQWSQTSATITETSSAAANRISLCDHILCAAKPAIQWILIRLIAVGCCLTCFGVFGIIVIRVPKPSQRDGVCDSAPVRTGLASDTRDGCP
jgi:hypothetical protein